MAQYLGFVASLQTVGRMIVVSTMEYRGFEFSVVQGLGRNFWRWYANVNGIWISGDARTEVAAAVEARKAIDRVLSSFNRK